MSTSKKKTIKFTALMTVLILTITYFSLLTPTSAYFYKEISDEGKIKFALLEVNDNEKILDGTEEIQFKGATKFADFDEKLFDEVAKIKEFTVTNTGEVPAKVMTRVTPEGDSAKNGLKYMIIMSEPYTESPAEQVSEENSENAETTTLPKGEIKKEIESRLDLFTGEETSVEYSQAVSKLDAHNEITNNIKTLNVGQSVDVKIYFWIEYDEVMSAAGGVNAWQNAESVTSIPYSYNIEMIASQLSENDEAVTEALKPATETTTETTTEATSQ